MANNSIEPFARQSSEGLGWADQWDYKFNDGNQVEKKEEPATTKDKMAEVSRKAKSAATTGFAKAKVGAKVGASKAKVGASIAATKMSAGVGWIKQKVNERRTPK